MYAFLDRKGEVRRMKLVDITCPSCGASLSCDEHSLIVECSYCGKVFYLDDEVQRVEHSVKDAEKLGYDLEKGKLKAQREEKEYQDKQLIKNKFIKILLWVVFFPIMIGYKVISSKKLDTETKVIIIVLLIGLVGYIMTGGLWH
jgi:predicted RNA-binding Zn-ribbon protein involved in translation (DUF1610 family)